ncbi:MAG: zeta toxin family protein [Azospirillum sp.]|nr:zeta toxin family protein [Azospirillum sp.]
MERPSPELHVIAGPNGSGKTTLTRKLLAHRWGAGLLYINPDEIARVDFGDWNDPKNQKAAADAALSRRMAALDARRNMAFETVFSTPEKIAFLRDAKKRGYFVRFYFVGTGSPTINAARVAERMMRGEHSVPLEKIISRHPKSIANAAIVVPHLDRAYIYDNSVDGEDPREILRVKDGLAIKVSENFPVWASPILDAVERTLEATAASRPPSPR